MNDYFTAKIETWYKEYGRDLPWRRTTDPYKVWISEVILQQTRVSQGLPYYERFLQRFPTVDSLAMADEDEVLLLWQGLGYYSRARNMHQAAKEIVALGTFPQDYKEIRSLRGIGEYTAAAISSFSFNQPIAVLDGNVYRVLSRYFGIEEPIDTSVGKKLFRSLAQEMLDEQLPALYNQAIMDFGAIQCTPQSPVCSQCPLAETCEAFAKHKVKELPIKKRDVKVCNRYFTYFLFEHPLHGFYLKRREGDDIWKGLYEPYLHEGDTLLMQTDEVQALFPHATILRSVGEVTHQLSHQRLHACCYHLLLPSTEELNLEGIWVAREQLVDYAFSRLVHKLIDKIL